jgi:hypothetical protein
MFIKNNYIANFGYKNPQFRNIFNFANIIQQVVEI